MNTKTEDLNFMKHTLEKIKSTFLLLLIVIPALSQNNNFTPLNGMTIGANYIVFEAEATESPLGKWQIVKPGDSRYKHNASVPPINETHLEFTGNDHNSGPATSPLEYKFQCPKTGTYRLGGRLFQRLEGQPDDKCNDVYIRMAGNFTSGNSIPTSVLKTNQKFFGRGVDKWGALYSIDTHDYGQAPVLYNLIEGEMYTFTVSGRAQRTNVDYWIIYDTSISYTLGAHKDIAVLNNEKYRPQITPETWTIEHPVIWATEAEKSNILEKINTYSWAQNIVDQLHATVGSRVNTHESNPEAILNTIPEIPADDNLSEAEAVTKDSHTKVLIYAAYSGILYYLTEQDKYAQFSADILSDYIDVLAARTPEKTTISGNYFYDPRTSYAHFSIAYDLIHGFLTTPGTQVYKKASGTLVDFDNALAQKAIYNIAVNALQEFGADDTHGKTISNHPVLRSPGVLFSILCVEDDEERERLFQVFWEKGTSKQNSFKNTILPMFGEQGIWPESTSYSFMPNITMILNVIDRIRPEMNVMAKNMSILDGNFLFDNLRLPDRRFVRYGDSKRNTDGTEALYQNTLSIAERRGFTEYEQNAKVALRQYYNAEGGFKPNVSTSTFDNYDAYRNLFWGIPIPETSEEEIDFQKPTVIIKHAGLALQRNYVDKSNTTYGLCGIIGGAHYVHSHVTGISMEIYGAGYVMGPGGGLPPSLAERNYPEHREYFMRHAGNNTVIVNGTSHGRQEGSWASNSYVWQNTALNVGAEPKHLEDPISANFSFATQHLNDEVNNCQQQRTLSIVRTSETSAYYFDMFRSKSLETNNFHDYVYHNLGDDTRIYDENEQEIAVTETNLYQNHIGDFRKSPGWIHFENTNVTEATDEAVRVRFDVKESGAFMHLFAPAGVERQYTKAVGPATREAKGSYINKKTQIIAIRQQGEAWDKPFVHVFEPAKSSSGSVQSMEHLYYQEAVVGAKVNSKIGNKTIEDFILCLPNSNSSVTLQNGISFTGRFAVVRYEQDLDTAFTTLYIGEGDSLVYGDITLLADTERRGLKVKGGKPYFGRQLLFKNVENKTIFPKGTNLSIEAIVGEELSDVGLWLNDTINLGTKTEAPFVWSGHPGISNIQNERYTLTLKARDAQGLEIRKTIVIETPSQKPYPNRDEPHEVPGKIEFEEYDSGGEGLGYFDNSGQDLSEYSYRDSSENVDLARNGTVVSFTEKGEWLEYTIDVKTSGFYQLNVRHRTIVAPGVQAFGVVLPNSGDTLLNKVETLYTGRSDFYLDAVGEFFLTQGKNVLRFFILNEGFDLDYMELILTRPLNAANVRREPKEIKVFPNPATENVTLELKGFGKTEISMYNMAGQLVFRDSSSESRIRIKRENHYTPGVYILRVLDENKQAHHQKFVFQ